MLAARANVLFTEAVRQTMQWNEPELEVGMEKDGRSKGAIFKETPGVS